MAQLSGPPPTSLELTLLSYEMTEQELNEAYPGRAWEATDANWLNVQLTVAAAIGSWSATAPALTTWDLIALIAWLRTVAAGEPHGDVFAGVEPNLLFQASGAGDALRLRVLVQLEYRPPWLYVVPPKDSPADANAEDVVVEFAPRTADLLAFADQLGAELAPFPVRA